jgi:predicted Zn-dependent protease
MKMNGSCLSTHMPTTGHPPFRGVRLPLLSALLVSLLLLPGSPTLPAQEPSASSSLTDAEEIQAGDAIAKDFMRQEGMEPTPQTRKIDAYLQAVGDRVAAHAQRKLPYQFRFDPSPTFRSAVGLPGGQIFVGAGILAYMDTEDQLAMVLGHEMEHIALNQCRERLIKVMTEQHLSAKDFGKLKADPFLDGYRHDGEFAADREGVMLAMEAGYSADAAIRLLRTYVILGEQMPNTPKEAKTNLEARIAQIESVRNASKLAKPAAEKPLGLP